MKKLPMIVIPRNYPTYTARRVHTAQWIDGEKLSQSKANDVGALVNLGMSYRTCVRSICTKAYYGTYM
jgi:aarF domain-containing kinase